MNPSFSSDLPINSPEEDLLSRSIFAATLATAIRNWKQKASIVIALYGRWGSGKSSLKNLVLYHLGGEYEVIEFMPGKSALPIALPKRFSPTSEA